MIRDDLSSKLVHLTRGEDRRAADAFLSIVRDRTLRGGTTAIRGGYRCVCFSEAPVSKLAHILANPGVTGVRYRPFGVMVDKQWIYDRGGRPAIYQPEAEYELLHESHRYRHVRYEPPEVDFTWEREWRLRADALELDPAAVTLVVPTRAWEQQALDEHAAMVSRWAGVVGDVPSSVGQFPWHYVVLEDLGIDFGGIAAP